LAHHQLPVASELLRCYKVGLAQKSFSESTDHALGEALDAVAVDGARLRRRSPALAGVMSAVVPGTGRIYAGRRADGILSLITIGVAGWQACSGFHRDQAHSVKGWVYGSLGAFLYVGNISGSVVAVRIANDQAEKKLLDRARVLERGADRLRELRHNRTRRIGGVRCQARVTVV